MTSSNPYGENPYASPTGSGGPPGGHFGNVRGKVLPPAIALIVVASIGLAVSLFNVVHAVVGEPVPVDPNAPPFVQQMQQGMSGPAAMVIQGIFALLNIGIIAGGVQMARMQSRPFAITASVMAMLNLGSCCCILGIPVGIWSLVILMSQDVTAAFNAQN